MKRSAVDAYLKKKRAGKSDEGFEPLVKKLKKHPGEVDNPWALAHWLINRRKGKK